MVTGWFRGRTTMGLTQKGAAARIGADLSRWHDVSEANESPPNRSSFWPQHNNSRI